MNKAAQQKGSGTMTLNNFFKIMQDRHDTESPRKTNERGGSYEIHYQNGDIYKHIETLKQGATPSSWSKCYSTDDFDYASYWNNELITL